MPVARSSVLWAHVLTSVVANAVSLSVVVAVAFVIGFRSPAGAGAWLAVGGILLLSTLARALLAGEAPGVDLWIALAWCAGILVAAYLGAAVAYRRRFR